ncbi:hypothetical protein [Aestuariivirga sp.]|uniref:hypothetical protein n=1 Tax=Aestuariivirga sp. TaxID=2650926 RepID=UPI0030175C8A
MRANQKTSRFDLITATDLCVLGVLFYASNAILAAIFKVEIVPQTFNTDTSGTIVFSRKYLARICKHFGLNEPVMLDGEDHGVIEFPAGTYAAALRFDEWKSKRRLVIWYWKEATARQLGFLTKQLRAG